MELVAVEFAGLPIAERSAASAENPDGTGCRGWLGEPEDNDGGNFIGGKVPVNLIAANYEAVTVHDHALMRVGEFGG